MVLAAERDFAVHEMRAMADHCQTVATEFEQLAQHCEALKQELTEVVVVTIIIHVVTHIITGKERVQSSRDRQ